MGSKTKNMRKHLKLIEGEGQGTPADRLGKAILSLMELHKHKDPLESEMQVVRVLIEIAAKKSIELGATAEEFEAACFTIFKDLPVGD